MIYKICCRFTDYVFISAELVQDRTRHDTIEKFNMDWKAKYGKFNFIANVTKSNKKQSCR